MNAMFLRGWYRDACSLFGFSSAGRVLVALPGSYMCFGRGFLLLWIAGEVSLSLRLLKMVGIYILLLIICANNLCYC